MPFMQPLIDRARRGTARTSKVKMLPPPTDGWNATEDLAGMKEKDAVALINALATSSGMVLRKGFTKHLDGISGAVTSLMVYNPVSGTNQVFAANATAIYDVTAGGAVGAAVVSSLTNGWWQHVMFSTTGGNFLTIANGVDTVRKYDGTTWSAAAITGSGLVSTNSLIAPMLHMARIWFIEQGTQNVWYLPALAVEGAASKLAFGSLSALGGELIAQASWTRDGGAGMDDLACFFTSEGEVHIYAGVDPDDPDQWARVGTFRIAKPIGRNCLVKAGADLGVLTVAGLLPLSSVLPLSAGGQAKAAATQRIDKAFLDAAAAHSGNDGWQVIEAPDEKLMIVNVPIQETTLQEQYVAYEGKWARFRGINVNCWAVSGSRLLMGSNDGRVLAYEGAHDEGEAIDAVIMHAFNDLGSDEEKFFKRVKPQFRSPPGYTPRVDIRLDWDDSNVVDFSASAAIAAEGAEWDVATWDVDAWAPGPSVVTWWQGASGKGVVVAPIIAISSAEQVTYNGCRILYEVGNGL